MYLSHQKNQLHNIDKKLECPSCGEIAMTIKKGSPILLDGMKITNISRWVCEKCGEELFDTKAMKEIRLKRANKTICV